MRDQAAFLALLGVEAAGLNVVFFHAQQAAEKAIKSVLTLYGIDEFRRTYALYLCRRRNGQAYRKYSLEM